MDVLPDAEVQMPGMHTGGAPGMSVGGLAPGGQAPGGHGVCSAHAAAATGGATHAGGEQPFSLVEQLKQELQELRDKYNRLRQFLGMHSEIESLEDPGESEQFVIPAPGFISDDEWWNKAATSVDVRLPSRLLLSWAVFVAAQQTLFCALFLSTWCAEAGDGVQRVLCNTPIQC
jgi:hypothetical protein